MPMLNCSISEILPLTAGLKRVIMVAVIKLVPGAGVEPAQKFLSEGF